LHNDWTYLQTGAEQIDHFVPGFDGALAGGYSRAMPFQYTEERDDRLMNSLIKTYAIEMKGDGGQPSGFFFLDKEGARAVSKEVVDTHMKFDKKADQKKFLDDHFKETWEHFDVNKDGIVEVERMPQFLRYLIGNALAIGL
jgi:hypothetical protein